MASFPKKPAPRDPESAGPLSRPVLLLTLTFFVNFATRSMIAPILPLLEVELGLSHTQAGSLFLFLSLGGFFSLLGSSLVLSRISYHRTISAGMLAMGLTVFLVSSSSSWSALVLTFIALGLTTGLYMPSALVIIQSMVPPSMLSRALAIHEMAPNLGLDRSPPPGRVHAGRNVLAGGAFSRGLGGLPGNGRVRRPGPGSGRGGDFKAHPRPRPGHHGPGP